MITNDTLTEHLRNTCKVLYDECIDESRHSTSVKTDVHTLSSAFNNITGTSYEKAIYRQLSEAIAGTSSCFETDPQKGCLLLAIGICVNMPPADRKEIETTQNIESPKESDIQTLTEMYEIANNYSDAQIFSRMPTDDKQLTTLRRTLFMANRAIPFFRYISEKVTGLYKAAREDVTKIKLHVKETTAQIAEDNKGARESLQQQITLYKDALEGKIAVTYMKQLSYPREVAMCTCGNCDAKIPASHILQTRSCNADISDIQAAAQALLLDSAANTPPKIRELIRNAGIVTPLVCNNCSCLNIPTLAFIFIFRLINLINWGETTRSTENNGAIRTYGANIVTQGLETSALRPYLKGFDINTLFASMRPQIIENSKTVEYPEINTADLFSRETYEAYMLDLSVQAGSKILEDQTQRTYAFLLYLLSTLNLVTVGTTPYDMIHSILNHRDFQIENEELQAYAEQLDIIYPELNALKFVHSVFTSKFMYTNYSKYLDIILTENTVQNIINDFSNKALVDSLMNDTIDLSSKVDLIKTEIELKSAEYVELRSKIKVCIDAITAKLLAVENKLYSTNATSLADIQLTCIDVGAKDLIMTACYDKSGPLYSTDVIATLWENLKDAYLPLLYQTVMYYSKNFVHNKLLFGGLFFMNSNISSKAKTSPRTRTANIIAKNVSGLTGTLVGSEDIHELFSELILACTKSYSLASLTQNTLISDAQLLRSRVKDIPNSTSYQTVINYNLLSKVSIYGDLTNFTNGLDVDDYAHKLMEDSEETLTESEASAFAEAAARFYIEFSPISTNKELLSEQLKG